MNHIILLWVLKLGKYNNNIIIIMTISITKTQHITYACLYVTILKSEQQSLQLYNSSHIIVSLGMSVSSLSVFSAVFSKFCCFPLNATLFASQAPPDRILDGSREMRNNGPVLMTEPLPINIEHETKTARKCKYSMINHRNMKRIPVFKHVGHFSNTAAI